MDSFAQLDADGFLPAPGESEEAFLLRVSEIRAAHAAFESTLQKGEPADIFGVAEVREEDRIAPDLVDEAAAKTETLYGFAVRHVPGFYLKRGIGLLWGGCMLGDPELHFSVFLLRDAFRKHRRFLNYTRDELLAHELCHSVRQSLAELTLEEYFAYRTSSSALRRYLGNCFIHDRDAILFLLPLLLLPVVQFLHFLCLPALPVWPFWLLALIYPAFLLRRNERSRRIVNRARQALTRCGAAQVEAILFRCTLQELRELGEITDRTELDAWIARRLPLELRWRIIVSRFLEPQSGGAGSENTPVNHEDFCHETA